MFQSPRQGPRPTRLERVLRVGAARKHVSTSGALGSKLTMGAGRAQPPDNAFQDGIEAFLRAFVNEESERAQNKSEEVARVVSRAKEAVQQLEGAERLLEAANERHTAALLEMGMAATLVEQATGKSLKKWTQQEIDDARREYDFELYSELQQTRQAAR
jgi:hypothetical protein